MAPFSLQLLLALTRKTFSVRQPAEAPPLIKRVVLLVLFGWGLLGGYLIHRVCWYLDDLFFPEYKKLQIRQPVFIIGNPRSGTTFLHRVMARDDERFFAFKLWEIFFPSIIAKKVLTVLGRIDARLGAPAATTIQRIEKRLLGSFAEMHPTGLFHEEEDEMLLLHIFASAYLIFLFPYIDELRPLLTFDRQMGSRRRRQVMAFYHGCLQRQAFIRGGHKQLLSKNPLFCEKIESLYQYFPDCRIIYLVRTPLEVIPSMISEGFATMQFVDKHAKPPVAIQQRIYNAARENYTYPLAKLDSKSIDTYGIVTFTELTQAPRATVEGLYRRFGYRPSPAFQQVLARAEKKSRTYTSRHRYALEDFAFSRDQIEKDFRDTFSRFGFNAATDRPPETGFQQPETNGGAHA